jgi:hypothetical protein
VNPFFANTIWLAAAVQLLHRELIPPQSLDKVLVSSNFELLCMTYRQFAKYWEMSDTLHNNLTSLEEELKSLKTLDKEVTLGRRMSFDSQSVALSPAKRPFSTVSGPSARDFDDSIGGPEHRRGTVSPSKYECFPSCCGYHR